MKPAHLGAGGRAAALSSALLILGAVPAGAVSQGSGLSPGCKQGGDGRVTCVFREPTQVPLRVNIPDGVTRAVMTLRGGAGGPGRLQTPMPVPGLTDSPGGLGGTASAPIALAPGQSLDVRVGGAGKAGSEGGGSGLGGGGTGNTLTFAGLGLAGGGGGGGSEVRIGGSNPAGTDPLIAAGGGGGGGSGLLGAQGPTLIQLGPGGAGGGTTGAHAPGIDIGSGMFAGGGQGGGRSAGGGTGVVVVPGLPPVMGSPGVRGQGGDAGMMSIPKMFEDGMGGGGGGGGGYFGGAAGSLGAGGGGGSGFGPRGTTFGTAETTSGGTAGLLDGEVVIAFDAPGSGAEHQPRTERTPTAATTAEVSRAREG